MHKINTGLLIWSYVYKCHVRNVYDIDSEKWRAHVSSNTCVTGRIFFSGSESPAGFHDLPARQLGAVKMIQQIVTASAAGGTDKDRRLGNEISAPYEFPQYPIEQIETKLIRSVQTNKPVNTSTLIKLSIEIQLSNSLIIIRLKTQRFYVPKYVV